MSHRDPAPAETPKDLSPSPGSAPARRPQFIPVSSSRSTRIERSWARITTVEIDLVQVQMRGPLGDLRQLVPRIRRDPALEQLPRHHPGHARPRRPWSAGSRRAPARRATAPPRSAGPAPGGCGWRGPAAPGDRAYACTVDNWWRRNTDCRATASPSVAASSSAASRVSAARARSSTASAAWLSRRRRADSAASSVAASSTRISAAMSAGRRSGAPGARSPPAGPARSRSPRRASGRSPGTDRGSGWSRRSTAPQPG